jgi:hypothetical protein
MNTKVPDVLKHISKLLADASRDRCFHDLAVQRHEAACNSVDLAPESGIFIPADQS